MCSTYRICALCPTESIGVLCRGLILSGFFLLVFIAEKSRVSCEVPNELYVLFRRKPLLKRLKDFLLVV
jgi:hypothetical protein